jgi:hypothetical protein
MLPWQELSGELDALDAVLAAGDRAGSLAILSRLVPEYAPDDASRQSSAA